ncbi:MAG TPA: AMP-binding protein, partial [Gammaproteobacteria bacterium]
MQPIDWIYRAARQHRDAIAVEAPGASVTFVEIVRRVDAFAAAIQAMEPRPRMRIGVCAHNSVEHVIAILAIMASGNIWVPLNPRDARAELEAKIAITQPPLIIVDEDCLALVENAGARLIVGKSGNDSASAMELLIAGASGKRPRRVEGEGTHTQAVKFTGGSSGMPKGVMQPYRAWIAGAINMLQAFRFDASDRFLLAAPLTHGTSCYLTPVLAAGGTLVLLGDRTTPEGILDAFVHRRISATFLPPTLIYMLMELVEGKRKVFESLRLLIYGAAPMPADRVREAQALFGSVVAANYGLTEAPQVITALTPDDATGERAASAGRAGLMTRV